MADNGPCDLCGLAIGAQVWTLRLPSQEMKEVRFCCDGCKGIYQMLNNIDDADALPAAGANNSQGEKS
jgi:hypothetical protein